jgi:hypothetical protein
MTSSPEFKGIMSNKVQNKDDQSILKASKIMDVYNKNFVTVKAINE